MNLIAKYFKKKWASSLGAVGSICVFVWFMGPKLKFPGFAPLRPAENRLICIVVLLLGWAIYAYYLRRKAKKNNDEMLDALADDADANQVKSAEASALHGKMRDAITLLKSKDFSSSGGKRYIYELPWYMIIGPPGAGKTTLLTNSGLKFPLEESHGKYSIKGVGGTRNCDWWFTDQAVLLDTAGRYTTQDSDTEIDKSAWETFLSILKDNRKKRPVNGLIVALALHDVINSDEDTLAQIAKTIRFRLSEVHDNFGMKPPVYLMITKCDLLAGFSEYFANFDEEQRKQVWGFTVSPSEAVNFPGRSKEELELLCNSLYTQVTTRLEGETSQAHKDRIYGFPLQFSAIQKKLYIFIEQFASESRLQEDIYLRGIYFTSATQDGSALDQLISSVSKSYGFAASNLENSTGTGKSFFINRLLTDVIFGESGLAGTNLKVEKRKGLITKLALGTIGLTTLGILLTWLASYNGNIKMMTGIKEASASLITDLDKLPTDNLDLIQTSQMLNHARKLDTTATDESFVLKRTGLYQGKTIASRASKKYDDLLIDTLLARLMVRLEHQMHAESENSEFLFEALKTYQMFDSEEHYSADDVIGWFKFDYDLNLPSTITAQSKQELITHTEHLFREKPIRLPRPLDKALITEYQKVAADLPIEKRAYHRLKQQHAESVNTPLKITETAGNDLAVALTLANGESFNAAIPTFFTVAEYKNRFLPSTEKVTDALASDIWVLGPYASSATSTAPNALAQSVIQQYYEEYISTWQTLLDNIQLRKSANLQELANFLSLLTDANSPLKSLLITVGDQTALHRNVPTEAVEEEEDSNERQQDLSEIIGNQKPNTVAVAETAESDPVSQHFEPLHELLDKWETNGSRLDSVLQEMADLNLILLPMATLPGASADPQLTSNLAVKLQQLSAKSERLPMAVASMVSGIANDIRDVSSGGYCAQLNSIWESEVYPFYKRALANRYPLSRRATNDITLEDFGRFFGPGGILENYTTEYLSSVVQKTPEQWTWIGTGNSKCLSDNTLKQLALADDIKQTFFTTRSPIPTFSFSLNPDNLAVDKVNISELHVNIGNNIVEFFHGPVKGSTNFTWPGQNGVTEASIRVEPPIAGVQSRISHTGPWAILRLLDTGKLKARNSSTVGVDYSFGGRPVSLEFRTSSFNPLISRALRQFSCPQTL